MPNIDERVVRMEFDNQQFEKGVSQSLKTIEDLKKALELDKMGESLKGLESATNTINESLNSIGRNAEKVANVFSPIGRIIQKELDQVADSAVRATKEIAAWTTGLAGLDAGQKKYESYTRSVQVITNATGKSVESVAKSLDKLMKYTDETSYDFSAMVENIGKFTSVGIDLERAEAAMEGIANWAAKSGAGKVSANRAMYNISQAMGAGYMKFIDWKSIENANMATKEFKEVAIQTAEAMGTLSKGEVDYKNFSETLKDGWLTAEVLTEVLAQYADTTTEFGLAAFHAAQEALTFTDALDAVKDAVSSGWMKSLEHIFGNLDEARVMWTNVANALIEFAEIFSETRNELLKGWHEMGGYNVMVEAASNIWQTFMNIVLGVKEALENVFPPTTAENLLAITNKIKMASENLLASFGIDRFENVEEEIEKIVDHAKELTHTLTRGTKGDEVKTLQTYLMKQGYLRDKYGADGIFGPNTKAAVEKLQKALGVDVTGAWDEATRKAASAKGIFSETITITKEVEKQVDAITTPMQRLQGIVHGFASALKIAWNLLKNIIELGRRVISIFNPLFDTFARVGAMFGEMIKNFSDRLSYVGTFEQTVDGITNALQPLANFIERIAYALNEFMDLYSLFLYSFDLENNLGNFFNFLLQYLEHNTILGPVISLVRSVVSVGLWLFDEVKRIVTGIGTFVYNAFTDLFLNGGLARLIEDSYANNGIIAALLNIFGYASYIVDLVSSLFIGLYEAIFQTDLGDSENSGISKVLNGIATVATIAANVLAGALGIIAQGITMLINLLGPFLIPALILVGQIVVNLSKHMTKGGVTSIPGFFIALGRSFAETETGAKVLAFVTEKLMAFKTALVGFVESRFPGLIDKIKSKWKSLGSIFYYDSSKGLFYNVTTNIELLIRGIKNKIDEIKNWLGEKFPDFTKLIQNNFAKVKELFRWDFTKTFADNIKDKLTIVCDIVKTTVAYIIEKLSELGAALVGQFTPDAEGNLPIVKTLSGSLAMFKPVVEMFLNIKDKFLEGWRQLLGAGENGEKFDAGKGFVSVLDKIKELGSKFGKTDVGKTVFTGIGALLGVHLVKSFAHVKNIAKSLDEGGIVGVLMGRGIDDRDTITDKIVKIAGSLVAASLALGLLSIINSESLKKNVDILSEIISIFAGVSVVMGQFKAEDVKIGSQLRDAALGIGIIALSIWGLMKVINGAFKKNPITGEDNSEALYMAIDIISKFLLDLGLIEIALAALGGKELVNVSGVLQMCAGLGVIVLAIGKMVDILKDNPATEDDNVVDTAIGIISKFLLDLGLIEIALAALGSGKVKISGILAMSAGLYLIVKSLGNLVKIYEKTKLSDEKMNEIINVLETIIFEVGLFGALMSIFGKGGLSGVVNAVEMFAAGKMFVRVIDGIAAAILKIKDVDPSLVETFAMAVTDGLLALTIMIAAFGVLGVNTFIGELGFLALIGVIAAGIGILGSVTSSTLDNFSHVLRNVGYRLRSFSDATEGVNWDAINKASEWLKKEPYAILSALASQYTNASAAEATMDNLWTIGIMLNFYGELMEKVASHGLEGSAVAYAMVEMAKAIVNVANEIVLPASMRDNSLPLIGAFLLIYATELDYLPTEDKSATALSMVQNAKRIADAAKDLSFSDEAARALVLVGAALKLYYAELADIGKVGTDGEALETPFDASKIEIDGDTIAKVMEALAKAIPKDAKEAIAAYKNGGDNDLIDFSLGITALASALKTYGEETKDINNNGQIDAANQALDGIVGVSDHITDLASDFDSADEFFNEYSTIMAAFTGNITTMGSALSSYGSMISTIDIGQVQTANTVLDKFLELDKYFNGENQLARIFNGFGTWFDEFIHQRDNTINSENMGIYVPLHERTEAIKEATEETSEIADEVAKLGLDPSTKIGKFSIAIAKMGQALKFYGEQIGGLEDSEGSIKVADEMLDHFTKISSSLEKVGGLIQLLGGQTQSLEGYSLGIGALGEELRNFQDAVNGISEGKQKYDALDASKLEQAFTVMERIMGWGKQFFDDNALEEYEGYGVYDMKFNRVIEGIVSSIESLAKLSTNKVGDTNVMAALTDTAGMINQLIADGIEKDEAASNSIKNAIANTIRKGIENADIMISGNKIEGLKFHLNVIGKAIGEGIGNAIAEGENNYHGIKNGIESAITAAFKAITEHFDNFVETGEYLNEGWIKGITNTNDMIMRTMVNLANSMLEAFQEVVQVESPSRKFEWIAQMCALGLKSGFDKYGYLVTDSTMDLGSQSLETIAAAFDTNKLGDVGEAALETVREMLNITDSKQLHSMVKQILVAAGYLDQADYNNIEKIKEAVKAFKSEVLVSNHHGETENSNWGRKETVRLLHTIEEQIDKDGVYDALQYEAEMLKNLSDQYVETADTITKKNKKVVKSNKKVKESSDDTQEMKLLKELHRATASGDTGDYIKRLQTYLNQMTTTTEKLKIDGIFGPKTKAAIEALQKSIGVTQTGKWDKETYMRLRALDEEKKIQKKEEENQKTTKEEAAKNQKLAEKAIDDRTDSILLLQKMLNERGYLQNGTYTVGEYDDMTRAALQLLEKEIGFIHSDTLKYDGMNKNLDWYTFRYYDELNSFITENGGLDKLLIDSIGSTKHDKDYIKTVQEQVKSNEDNAKTILDLQTKLEKLGYIKNGDYIPGRYDSKTGAAEKQFNLDIYGETDPSEEVKKAIDDFIIETYGSYEDYLDQITPKNEREAERLAERKERAAETQMYNAIYGSNYMAYKKHGDNDNYHNGAHPGEHGKYVRTSFKLYSIDTNGNYVVDNRGKKAPPRVSKVDYDFWTNELIKMGRLAARNYSDSNEDVNIVQEAFNGFIIDIFGKLSNENLAMELSDAQEEYIYSLVQQYGSLEAALRHLGEKYTGGYKYEASWMKNPEELSAESIQDMVMSSLGLDGEGLMDGTINALTSGVQGAVSVASEQVEKALNKVIFGETDENGETTGGLAGAVDNLKDVFIGEDGLVTQFATDGIETGRNLVEGIKTGLTDKTPEAENAADTLGGDINTALENKEQIASPSKVWYGYGNMLIHGLIKGMVEKKPFLAMTVGVLTSTMQSAFISTNRINNGVSDLYVEFGEIIANSIIRGINNKRAALTNAMSTVTALNNAIQNDGKPTNAIRPVVSSAVVGGQGFNQSLIRINNGINAANAIASGIQQDMQLLRQSIEKGDKDLLDQFKSLGNQLDRIDRDMSNLKIYLNGRTLVGGIVADMDSALARRNNMALRRV